MCLPVHLFAFPPPSFYIAFLPHVPKLKPLLLHDRQTAILAHMCITLFVLWLSWLFPHTQPQLAKYKNPILDVMFSHHPPTHSTWQAAFSCYMFSAPFYVTDQAVAVVGRLQRRQSLLNSTYLSVSRIYKHLPSPHPVTFSSADAATDKVKHPNESLAWPSRSRWRLAKRSKCLAVARPEGQGPGQGRKGSI